MRSGSFVSSRVRVGFARAVLSLAIVGGLGVVGSSQVQLDVCGCKNNPGSLGNFNTLDPNTYPPGTATGYGYLVLPLPPDGVMVFNSMNIQWRPGDPGYLEVFFARNAANTPATVLVSGDVTLRANTYLRLSGEGVVGASQNVLGKGSLGGPGGFRGGDAGYQLVNFARMGGAGSGPGGGLGGNDNYYNNGHGANASSVGAPDLLPLIGGSGGGGGASICDTPGAGGGGTITIDGDITADGASGGAYGGNPSCGSYGGGGSGGAIRLLATTLAGSGHVYARGGGNGVGPVAKGAIRMEALNNNMTVGQTDPIASRTPGPGPIVNPVTPTVAITTVAGQPVPTPPQGGNGVVDLVLAAPGQTSVGLATSGVPTGTTVNVTVKPRVGGAPVTTPATLTNCDVSGACLANVSFNLGAGAYFVEARATFQTP
jgi:hypothetical protein